MHSEYRSVMADLEHRDDLRAVVVTGTPPAFCVGGDSTGARRTRRPWRLRQRTSGRASRSPVAAIASTPISSGSSATACRSSPRSTAPAPGSALALVAYCDLRFVAADAKITTAAPKLGSARRVRAELDAAATDRRDPGQRPAPVGPGGHRRGDRRVGSVERRRARTVTRRSPPPRRTPRGSSTTTGPHAVDDDQASDRCRSAPPRSGRFGRRFAPTARRGDAHRGVSGGRQRSRREAPTELLTSRVPLSREAVYSPPVGSTSPAASSRMIASAGTGLSPSAQSNRQA